MELNRDIVIIPSRGSSKSGYQHDVIRLTIKGVRKKAVREFAERLLELFPSDKKYTTISRFAISQIAKEMTEGEG